MERRIAQSSSASFGLPVIWKLNDGEKFLGHEFNRLPSNAFYMIAIPLDKF